MFRPRRGANISLASLVRRIYRLGELSGTTRWLVLAVIVVLFVAFGYAILRLSPYLEGFEQYGYLGAFLVYFICSTTILFPTPGFVVAWTLAANPAFSWAAVGLAAGVGGALGEFMGYLAGYSGVAVITPEQSKLYKKAEYWMGRYGSLAIFFFALTWIPFDLAGIVAGALRFPFWKFLLATIAGHLPRTLLGCYVAYMGWELLRGLAWWDWVIIGVGATVIIGGIIIIWRRRRAGR